jgi:glycosyltransferase involved in cell wall biosynthesis
MITPTQEVPVRAARPLRRVLFVMALDPSQKFGSLEEQVWSLAHAFRAQGGLLLPLFICPPTGPKPREFRDAGLPVEYLDLRRLRPSPCRRLLRLVAAHHIEVVHWHFTPPLVNGYLWLLTLLAPRVRHFFTDHNSRPWPVQPPRGRLGTALKRLLLRRYAKVIGVSRFVADCLAGQRAWSNVTCLLHFINTERFKPDVVVRRAVRDRLLARPGQFVLVTIAHLIEAKGVEVALRALALLPEAVVFWVVGDGTEAPRLRDLARQLGVAGRVRFLGLQKNVEPYLQAADCYVCPSLWAEAAGLVNLEAQACGLPVVGSAVGGIPEYVEDGRTGYLFAPGDHRQLAEKVRYLHDHPHALQQMGLEARARAGARFACASRIHEYLDLYRCPL